MAGTFLVTGNIARSSPDLEHTKLKLRRFRHHAWVPGRIQDDFDLDLLDARHALDFAFSIRLEYGTHATPRRGQCHFYLGLVPALGQGRDLTNIHEAEVNSVDGDLGIVDGPQLIPDQLLDLLRTD